MKGIFKTTLITASLTGGLSTAIANPSCPPEDAYCLYITDPSGQDGPHWFRVNQLKAGKSSNEPEIVCERSIEQSPDSTLFEILKEDLVTSMEAGDVEICLSAKGPCDKLDNGRFQVFCDESSGTCKPSSQGIQLTTVEKRDYPECQVTPSSNKSHLHQ